MSTLIQQYQQGFALREVVFRLGGKLPLQFTLGHVGGYRDVLSDDSWKEAVF